MTKKSLHSIKDWKIDVGFQHPLCSIRSYHIFSQKDCNNIIEAGEEAAQKQGGWTTDRHDEAPTTDIPFDIIGGSYKLIFQKWKNRLIRKILTPILFRDYHAKFISFEDFFLVRYTTESQPGLKIHRDGTVISCVIQLNNDFEGGGTYIENLGHPLRHNTGDICIHSGWFRHGAYPIQSGIRYVLIGFCNIEAKWYTHHKLQPSAPYEPDHKTLRRAIKPEFRILNSSIRITDNK